MPITEFLERNAREFPNDICLVEINPEIKENRRVTWKEYELIELLVLNPNKVYSRSELLTLIWGADYPGDVRTVDVHIRRLREKIEKNPSEPKYVHTKWGVGYYFKA